ncbi:hypothetical protein BUALT_Bualt13G0043300 [Buddleja alternifolia]|uniref:Homeobox domain-containing protein n=1 Tax=Buddleja alternifolia TaxID=168488 RepID=A0AAV6WRV4_9LAMI|nr:hypothetical protein BUALT_Bualt13G0043300 [Buddleja alternifolia]
MEEESHEMHSEDDKALLEKNKKKTVKTRAQVQALEKLYTEHKYPTEAMKIQLAESIGLSEKQVSGWFCHRRLKDKRLINGENFATGRQDRSSGVIQDRVSGHRQDSCGSTKPGDDRNHETREVESERLTPKELSAADHLTYEHGSHYAGNYNRVADNTSSGSSSSLRNMPGHQNGDPFDVSTSRYLVPKFPVDVKGLKPRPGPSGYLKVKGQVENAAVTAVKKQLGKHYREDGPPLGVEFDPLPPGAFESQMEDAVDETHYSGEPVLPASPDVSKIRQNRNFGKGCDNNSSMASYNSNIDGTSFRTRHNGYNIPNSHIHQKYKPNTSSSNGGVYYRGSNSSLEMPEGSDRDVPASDSRDDNGIRPRPGYEVMRTGPISRDRHFQPYGGKVREYNDAGTKVLHGEKTDTEYYSKLTMKGNEYHNSEDKGPSRQIIKDGKFYADRRIINENRDKIPSKNDVPAPKRIREDYPWQQHAKTSSVMDNEPRTYQVIRSAREMPSSYSDDEESAETDSSVD